MPRIENTVSLGNIISIVGTVLTAMSMVGAMVYWGGRLSERADSMEREMLRLQSTAAAHETRIRSVEQMSARQDERLVLILDALRKIEARLDNQN